MDIVERLRRNSNFMPDDEALVDEAAGEIENLRDKMKTALQALVNIAASDDIEFMRASAKVAIGLVSLTRA